MEASILRQKALEQLKLKQSKSSLLTSEKDMKRLIHELQVHQIELEMQNEELVIATEKTKLAEEKYTELYDFAPSGYVSLSKEGRISTINFKAARMIGKERLYLLKKYILIFISENTQTIFNDFLENIFTQKIKQSCEVVFTIKNNLPLYVNIEGVISNNNEFCNLTLVDITKRKLTELNLIKEKEKKELSESKYKEIISRVDDAIFGYDPDTFEIVEANNATSKIYGYDHSELIGMSCLKFSRELDKTKVTSEEIKHSGVAFVKVRRHKKKDGTPIFVQIQGYKIFMNEKPFVYVVSHDITSNFKYEKELIIAKEKAEESDRLKSAFLANMSHEIRTPMNGILGFSELLKQVDLKSENQQEYIKIIEKSGNRMLNIINEIIDISKIESGLMKIYTSDVDVNHCLEDNYVFFKPEAEKKNIELKFPKLLSFIDAITKTDPDKLNGILVNLIKNALKYTNSGSIEFGCNLNNSKTELQFYVKDTGIGIPKDRQAAIFKRFIQADVEDKMARQGAGLGLTISSAYVKMLKGKLWLESEVNVGSTFYFTLPYRNEAIPEAVVFEEKIKKQKPTKNLKILIVEDDKYSNQLLTYMLSDFGKEIMNVSSGSEAIEICKNNPDIDLILMDIQMPEMNGYEATKQIREFNKKVIIIAQTAFALSGDREKSIEIGCNDYITKPIKKDELMSLVNKYY